MLGGSPAARSSGGSTVLVPLTVVDTVEAYSSAGGIRTGNCGEGKRQGLVREKYVSREYSICMAIYHLTVLWVRGFCLLSSSNCDLTQPMNLQGTSISRCTQMPLAGREV